MVHWCCSLKTYLGGGGGWALKIWDEKFNHKKYLIFWLYYLIVVNIRMQYRIAVANYLLNEMYDEGILMLFSKINNYIIVN